MADEKVITLDNLSEFKTKCDETYASADVLDGIDLTNYVTLDGEQTIAGQKTILASDDSGKGLIEYGTHKSTIGALGTGTIQFEVIGSDGTKIYYLRTNNFTPNNAEASDLGAFYAPWGNIFIQGALNDGNGNVVTIAQIIAKQDKLYSHNVTGTLSVSYYGTAGATMSYTFYLNVISSSDTSITSVSALKSVALKSTAGTFVKGTWCTDTLKSGAPDIVFKYDGTDVYLTVWLAPTTSDDVTMYTKTLYDEAQTTPTSEDTATWACITDVTDTVTEL